MIARLRPLADVGLDYLRLGQPVPTLSGGEAQRLKLAGHLVEASGRPVAMLPRRPADSIAAALHPGIAPARTRLFLFDEPTTGLHFDDVAKLLAAFRRLIAAGHSIIVIEHNLDVVRASDWLVDLGPEGGDAGGELVFAGTPADAMRHATSHTGKALLDYDTALNAKHHPCSSVFIRVPEVSRPHHSVTEPLAATARTASRFATPASTTSRTSTSISRAASSR